MFLSIGVDKIFRDKLKFYNIHFTKFLILYLLFEQSISSLKQFEMHAESVGSQVAMHSNVSSTQISLQTVLRS